MTIPTSLDPAGTTPDTTTPAAATVHDARRFWRVLLALLLPLPWLAKGIEYVIHDYGAGDESPTGFRVLLDGTFTLLVVPSVLTLVWIGRRGAPRLATAGALLMGGGFQAALAWGTDDDSPGALGFLVAILFGSIVVGLALWKSRAVPLWVALAVALGGATHIFLSFNHVVHGLGLVVVAAGCVGAGAALLRSRDDDFDLPPLT
jgi:hypothetical protein